MFYFCWFTFASARGYLKLFTISTYGQVYNIYDRRPYQMIRCVLGLCIMCSTITTPLQTWTIRPLTVFSSVLEWIWRITLVSLSSFNIGHLNQLFQGRYKYHLDFPLAVIKFYNWIEVRPRGQNKCQIVWMILKPQGSTCDLWSMFPTSGNSSKTWKRYCGRQPDNSSS